jgi:hypothetical protein
MHNRLKYFSLKVACIAVFVLSTFNVNAQDDLLQMLEDSAAKPEKEFVTATFKGTRLINFPTVEVPGKRSLDFRIAHHFGDLNQGAYNFFGLDGGASIRLSLEYSYEGRFEYGLGRSSYEKTFDGFLKYRLLKQTKDNKMPLSVTLFSSMFYASIKDPNKAATGIDRYQYTSSRLSYANEIIIARKMSDRFSLQVAPTLVHYNLVDQLGDKNDLFAVCFAGRIKYSNRGAITLEYGYRANKYSVQQYYDAVGIGVDIETGGHVFQMYFTNTVGMIEPQYLGRNSSRWQNFGLKLGFNISRMFTI